jgi:hypothetical protein
MLVEGRKLDMTRLHLVPFGTIIMIHTRKQPNSSYPCAELGIVLGPNEATYNAMDTMSIYIEKIMIRHQYTILQHIRKEFSCKLHDQSVTPAALIKRINAAEKPGKKHKQQKGEEVLQPDDLTLSETQELLDSIGSKQTHPIPIHTHTGPLRELTEIHTNTITMRVPMQAQSSSSTAQTETVVDSNTTVVGIETTNDNKDITHTDTAEQSQSVQTSDTKKRLEISDTELSEGKTMLEAAPLISCNKIKKRKIKETGVKAVRKQQKTVTATTPVMNTDNAVTFEEQEQTNFRRSHRGPILSYKDGARRMGAVFENAYKGSVTQALRGEHEEETNEAVRDEINNMLSYKVGHYIQYKDIPTDMRVKIRMAGTGEQRHA